MCGIGGHVTHRGLVGDAGIATRMAAQLAHRGPDGAAFYTDDQALLVHTRLGIIDLETGAQPLCNEDRSLWLTCNGEIFNYVELRAELTARGHRFRTGSDCEVILHLYEEYGLDFVDHLNGQFAFCLWDANSRTAVLVRDRVGIAPLFYSEDRHGLWFASEVKAIIAGRQERPCLDLDGFNQLLHFWAPVAPNSVFAGVRELPPGEMAIYSQGQLTRRRYWDLNFPARDDYEPLGAAGAAEQLRCLLSEATELRLRADVPVAAYLSGGLDSSVITSLIRQCSTAQLRTFSLTFADQNLDESGYQAEVVKALRTEHSSVRCDHEQIGAAFEKTIWHTEMPIVRSAPVPMGLLSGLVKREGMRVVLTGEGADEVLGGYDIFKEAKLRRFWAANPESTWRPLLVRRLYPYLQLSRGKAHGFLANFFGSGVDQPEHPLFSHQPRINTTSRIGHFLSEQARARMGTSPEAELLESLPEPFHDWSFFCKAQYLEMKTLMSGYLLSAQGDRMLMQNGVEGRFPFLDHRVIEFANRLHPRLKMRVLREKHILKEAMAGDLPHTVLNRHKQPYRAPMSSAFFGSVEPDYVRYLLDEKRLAEFGYFDPRKVSLLLKKIRAGRPLGYKDNMAFMVILSTQSWHQQFIAEYPQRFAVAEPNPSLQKVA
ncbi:asparagine synthase (glutamine-hydrolyzing) [Gilvimarinus sp. F26214L]|uniref:asparagine synthase (glutamine-hydrolyzing) n=1 Tax=Gilvimarinus sp. DZF01 TaxID=3461371 RepID=UPI004045761B